MNEHLKLNQESNFDKTVLSNRRLDPTKLYMTLSNFKWSLDRITLVGTCSVEKFQRIISANLSAGFFKVQGNGFKIANLETGEDLAYCEMAQYQENILRFDFNPNKISELEGFDLKSFIHSMILDPHFSRLDDACDIYDVPDSVFQFATIFKRCMYKPIIGQWGDVQSHYWGSRQSEVYIRLYNKRIEQNRLKEEKRDVRASHYKTWWRWEAELKRESATQNWRSLVKENLDLMIFNELLVNESASVQADVFVALNAPQIFKQFDRRRKSNIRKIITKAMEITQSELVTVMLEAFERDEESIKKELKWWLNQLEVSEEAVNEVK